MRIVKVNFKPGSDKTEDIFFRTGESRLSCKPYDLNILPISLSLGRNGPSKTEPIHSWEDINFNIQNYSFMYFEYNPPEKEFEITLIIE